MPGVRLSAESSKPLPSIESGQGLLEILERHRPFLSDTTFVDFSQRTVEYLGQIPVESSNNTSSDVEASPYSGFEASWVVRNEALRNDGVLAVEELRGPLSRRVREEFAACRINEEDPEVEKALGLVETALDQTRVDIDEKSERYLELLEFSANRTDIAAEELVERMTEALADMSAQVLASPKMPPRPTGRRKRKENEAIYNSWELSKAKLLGKLALPDRDEILTDYYRSADASFRRTLYGSRRIVLDRGFNPDKKEIDSFQRRFYDELGGYKIALTPREWAVKALTESVDWLLYAPVSPTATLLNASDAAQNGSYSSREYRKRRYQDKDRRPSDHEAPPFVTRDHVTVAADVVKPKNPEDNLDEQEKEIYRDMELLVDSRLFDDYSIQLSERKQARAERTKVMNLCATVIGNSRFNLSKYAPASDELRLRIIGKMIAAVHPDNEDGGDEALCKVVTGLQTRVKTEQKQ